MLADATLSADVTAPAASPAPADWRPFLNDDLKADPIVAGFAGKTDYKDIPALIKGMAHAQHRMGSAINLPGKDAAPEDLQALKQKLYDAGVFPAPPTDASVYNLTKPETLPDGIGWNDELATSFGDTLLKHGASKALADDMLALYGQALTGTQAALKVVEAESLATLKAEHKEHFDEHLEAGERLAKNVFTDPAEVEFFQRTGIGKSPRFLSVMMRLGQRAMQDSSFVAASSSQPGSVNGAAAFEELTKIQTDPAHPMHKAYRQNDPKVRDHIDDLYRKAYPGTVELG